MGNHIPRPPGAFAGKVILSDGTVHEFDHPLTVAELMLDHPQHFVAEFRSIAAGNKPAPLPADQMLDTKKVYVMLPLKRGKASALPADETRRILARASSALRLGLFPSSSWILPPLTRMWPAGIGNRRGEECMINGKDGTERSSQPQIQLLPLEGFDDSPGYLNRQFSGKGWKPTLDTIKEVGAEKVPHWLF